MLEDAPEAILRYETAEPGDVPTTLFSLLLGELHVEPEVLGFVEARNLLEHFEQLRILLPVSALATLLIRQLLADLTIVDDTTGREGASRELSHDV